MSASRFGFSSVASTRKVTRALRHADLPLVASSRISPSLLPWSALGSTYGLPTSQWQRRNMSRLEFQPPHHERVKLAPSLLFLGATGLAVYYLYSLYAKTQIWPPDVRADLRAAIKARRVGDVDTAAVYYQRALDTCLAYDDIQTALGSNYRLMLAGIVIAVAGAYEDDASAPITGKSSDGNPDKSPSSSTPSSSPYVRASSSPTSDSSSRVSGSSHWTQQHQPQKQRRYQRLGQAYSAYETAFVILTSGRLDDHVWEHLVRVENRDALRRLDARLQNNGSLKSKSTPPSTVQHETYYRLVQASSHLSYLAGELSRGAEAEAVFGAKDGVAGRKDQEPHSYEELEALHALFALSAFQQRQGQKNGQGLSLGLGVPRTSATAPGRDGTATVLESPTTFTPASRAANVGSDEKELQPSELMSSLDAHGPLRLDYAYLLERAAEVFANQGATLQALHLYRSAADALVPELIGDPESWMDIGPDSTVIGRLPARETCQVAIIVNNMANACAGTRENRRSRTKGRSGQPPPDVARAKRLAQAAAKLVEIVSPRQAVGSSSLKDRFKNSRREVVMIEECELARLATLFNIGVLSEMEKDVSAARAAYEHTRVLAEELTERLNNESGDLRVAASEANAQATAALGGLR